MASSQLLRMRGYVTKFSCVSGKSSSQLEAILGYNAGALSSGYTVYELVEPVRLYEFEWKDRTMYSEGWHADSSIQPPPAPNLRWGVQRADELRAALGKKLGYNERAVDAEIASILAKHFNALNVRHGPEKIVKIKPAVIPSGFPASEVRNIPQWRLQVEKLFRAI